MSATQTLQALDWPDIERAIIARELPTFRTRRDAVAAGRTFGFAQALRLVRRFEIVWLCAQVDFQPDLEGDLAFTVVRVPLMRWHVVNGAQTSAVVKFRRFCASIK